MSGSSILGTIYSDFLGSLHQMLSSPVDMLKFTIPVAILFAYSFTLQRYTKKQRIDSLPSFESRREIFQLPEDEFNVEVADIMRENYSKTVSDISRNFNEAKLKYKRYRKLIKEYTRYNRRMTSSIRFLKKRAVERRKDTLRRLVDLEAELESLGRENSGRQ